MKLPRSFKKYPKHGYSMCIACLKWRHGNNMFFHEGRHWILCELDYVDYWENTDELRSDFKAYY